MVRCPGNHPTLTRPHQGTATSSRQVLGYTMWRRRIACLVRSKGSARRPLGSWRS